MCLQNKLKVAVFRVIGVRNAISRRYCMDQSMLAFLFQNLCKPPSYHYIMLERKPEFLTG